MRSRLLALFVLVGTTFAQTATPPTVPTVEVWPGGKMPGNGAKEPAAEVPRSDGFHRITNVSRPTLTLFPAPRKAGAAVVNERWTICFEESTVYYESCALYYESSAVYYGSSALDYESSALCS
jgi:hypothetical protein